MSGVTQFVVDADTPGVTVTPLTGLDLTRRFADVRFDGVSVPTSAVLGAPGGAQASVDAQLDVAVALTLAESIGAMRRLAEITSSTPRPASRSGDRSGRSRRSSTSSPTSASGPR